MADDVVIRAERVGKKYIIGHESQRERYVALRDVIARSARNAWRKTADMARGRAIVAGDTIEEFWALKDVSFEVKRGEVLGIIGRNGAGKSTLLKILSRITEPTEGRVTINGRVASLLEVGTGFHPELTGRENIYLNGAILGMAHAEIKRKFDEIVAFAEIEKFLDTPVKRYSSGMYVRLAFAVAAHLEPEILIVDEVLSVGDSEFQKKCLGKMDEVSRSQGRTVVFVSHNAAAVKRLCSLGALFQGGRLRQFGSVAECLDEYAITGSQPAIHYRRPFSKEKANWIVQEAWFEQNNNPTDTIDLSVPVYVVIRATGQTKAKIAAEFIIRDENRYPILFCPSGLAMGQEFSLKPGNYIIRVRFIPPQLASGRYYVDLMLARSGIDFFDYLECAVYFDVALHTRFENGWIFKQQGQQGPMTFSPDECQFECIDDS
jgi:lipopolysaccharide transport system ATP-binding protein